jgi:hypothetical protein
MVSWIIAYREGDYWQAVNEASSLPESLEMAEGCDKEWIGIFRHRPDWADYKPRYVIDRRDKSKFPIMGLGGLINSLDSSWF